MRLLVTGGAGFIGSSLIKVLLKKTTADICNVDKLTYAAMPENLEESSTSERYQFVQADICDQVAMKKIFSDFQPTAILHLAAESHVDRSISGASDFMQTNIMGTFTLLEVAKDYWEQKEKFAAFRFIHVSTDEVYGDLPDRTVPAFTEETAYQPNSPYSASKAASDHLARAWYKTYGLPVIITHCSNNYGAGQYPEKLIPVTIFKALSDEALPIYGKGVNIRDWIHVEDHAKGILSALLKGKSGEVYNFGGECEVSNIDLVKKICAILDEESPHENLEPYFNQHQFVADRKGHDFRYAIDNTKVINDLGWQPEISFEQGLYETVKWYLEKFEHEGHYFSRGQRNKA